MREYSVAVTVDVTIRYNPTSAPETAADLREDAAMLLGGACLDHVYGIDEAWVASVDQVRVYRGQFGKGAVI
jgi:hypothetical protein